MSMSASDDDTVKTLPGPVSDPSKLPKWNYDGSSTGQAAGEDSDVILLKGNHILVMCDAYTPACDPIPTNKRHNAAKIFSHPNVASEEPWYEIEQEYTLMQKDVNWPIGWPVGGFPGPQGPYYLGVGADKAIGRDIVDAHYKPGLFDSPDYFYEIEILFLFGFQIIVIVMTEASEKSGEYLQLRNLWFRICFSFFNNCSIRCL